MNHTDWHPADTDSPALWAISMENRALILSVNAFPVASKFPP